MMEKENNILSIDELVMYIIPMMAKVSSNSIYGNHDVKIPSEIVYLIHEYINCSDFYYDNVVSRIIDMDEYNKEWEDKFITSLIYSINGMSKYNGKKVDFNNYTKDYIIDYVDTKILKDLDKVTYKELKELCKWVKDMKLRLIKEGTIDNIYTKCIKKMN